MEDLAGCQIGYMYLKVFGLSCFRESKLPSLGAWRGSEAYLLAVLRPPAGAGQAHYVGLMRKYRFNACV